MSVSKTQISIFLLMSLLLCLGCSSANPVAYENPDESIDSFPMVAGTDMDGILSGIGLLGVYEITVDPDTMDVEVHSKRKNTIGESYLVSGLGFFSVTPCGDCLKLSGLSFTPPDKFILTFTISHPFDKGNTGAPPTAVNRLDLDVFDLAAVIHPKTGSPKMFPFYFEQVYSEQVIDPDGFSQDLFEVTLDVANLPYFLVIDESEMDPIPNPTTWNNFEMGATANFDVRFRIAPGQTMRYDMYLTMGYGASATKPSRLAPKYYNPEFNRKAAWKVVVTPPQGDDPPALGNTWDDADDTTTYDVRVEVYDWQTGAVESIESDFSLADPSEVYAISEVTEVRVEIEGMTANWVSTNVDDGTGTGMPGSPLVYILPVQNKNFLPPGEYAGLVFVEDSRLIGDPYMDDRDILIHTDNGADLINMAIPIYGTYQVFTATVVDAP